jgi:hypothetical protein
LVVVSGPEMHVRAIKFVPKNLLDGVMASPLAHRSKGSPIRNDPLDAWRIGVRCRSDKFSNSAKSGYNKGTIRSDLRYLVVSKDVRRHRFCHGRGREFESRRPRHSFQAIT